MVKKLLSLIIISLLITFSIFINAESVLAISLFQGQTPTNLGVKEGFLKSCPTSPNCVVSQNADESHKIEPISYELDRNKAKELLLKILTVVPNTTIVEQKENYIHIESASSLLGFIDDGEFYFPEDEKVIHLRSASRLGQSDLGVNRRRLEQIRLAMKDLMNDYIKQ